MLWSETIVIILETAWRSAVQMSPYLLAGILLAAAVQAFVPQPKLQALFVRAGLWPVILATLAAITTPLCSCTTVSVMIPLLAAGVPWGPIFAWLIASPMVSPTGFMLVGGIVGWDMAIARVIVAAVLGFGGGVAVDWLSRRGWLAGQSRIRVAAAAPHGEAAGCQGLGSGLPGAHLRWMEFGRSLASSVKTLVPVYVLFLVVAAAVRVLVPNTLITAAFGDGQVWAIPTAAALGMPLYTSIGSAVPMVSAMVALGMGRGAALAFLLTGPGTSLPALGALLAVAKGRVLALYLAFLFTGAILAAMVFQGIG